MFSQFEKEKQHDIRSFFSPSASKEKKRTRTDDEETSPSICSERSKKAAGRGEKSEPVTPEQDFSPQQKRLRTPKSSWGSRSGLGGKRRLTAAGMGSSSPASLVSFKTSQKFSEPGPEATWNCEACTYANSSLLPFCEMCECPRSSSLVRSGKTKGTFFFKLKQVTD